MLQYMNGRIARSRATGESMITVELFKATVEINSDEDQQEMFFQVFEELDNSHR